MDIMQILDELRELDILMALGRITKEEEEKRRKLSKKLIDLIGNEV